MPGNIVHIELRSPLSEGMSLSLSVPILNSTTLSPVPVLVVVVEIETLLSISLLPPAPLSSYLLKYPLLENGPKTGLHSSSRSCAASSPM